MPAIRPRRIRSVVVLMVATIPVVAAGQQFLPTVGPPADPNTRFEEAAIKPLDGWNGQLLMQMTPGRFESYVSVSVVLRQALQKPDYEIVGAPGWIDSERYSITAKVPEGVPLTAMAAMLTNLLKDRFQLATHLETRERPIFELVVARPDGKLGPSLKPTPAECQAIIAERMAASKAALAGRGGPPPLPSAFPGPNDPLPCGFSRGPIGRLDVSARTFAQVVTMLADLVGRPVIDKTGLTGLYDFTLRYAPEGRVLGPFGPVPGAPPPVVDPDAPGLSVALQEQLGLKLESSRGPVEVLVVDRIERPTLD